MTKSRGIGSYAAIGGLTAAIALLTGLPAASADELADLRANPKPTYSIDGQTVSWTDYVRALQETVDWCDAKLIGLAPFEIQSQATT